MKNYPHTWDGKHITAGVTGWSEYRTDDKFDTSKPPIAVSLQEVLSQIRSIRETISQPRLERALRDLYNHINDHNNPHRTDLDQFSKQVADVLYQEYLNNGGTGTLDFYLQSLFYTLRVATVDEMETSDDENLLISVKGAHRVIAKHENDPNAHAALFDQWFPGLPVSADPIVAINATIGVQPTNVYVKNERVQMPQSEDTPSDQPDSFDLSSIAKQIDTSEMYTIIDHSGRLVRKALNRGVQGDWGFRQPLLPCFGDHTNLFTDSKLLNDDLLSRQNVGYRTAVDIVAPDGSDEVTEVYTTQDVSPVEHNLVRENFDMPVGMTRTISLFVRAGDCHHLAIRYVDMVATGIEVQAIYDLDNCHATVINGMGRYGAEIQRLSNGWCRCCFTLNHHIGQRADLKFTFFNMVTTDIMNSLKYQSVGGVAGWVWGLQLENNVVASPYIDTTGGATTEKGYYYLLDIENKFDVNNMTISIQFKNMQPWGRESLRRPIFYIVDSEWRPILTVNMINTGAIIVERFVYITISDDVTAPIVDYYDAIAPSPDDWCKFAISIGRTAIRSNCNGIPGLGMDTPKPSEAGYRLLIGCNEKAESLHGYIREFTVFDKASSEEELEFITGEIINE